MMAEGTPICGVKRSAFNRGEDGPVLPGNKRMQSPLVITGPDGRIITRDSNRELFDLHSSRSKFDSAKAKQHILTRQGEADIMFGKKRKPPTIRQPAFSTPQPSVKTAQLPVSHPLYSPSPISRTPVSTEITTTPVPSSRSRPPLSGRKLKARAAEKLRVLDDHEYRASRIVQARLDFSMGRQERAYIAWLNHVLDRPATASSRVSNFEDFVSRNSSTNAPSSNTDDFRLIDEVYWDEDCQNASPRTPASMGRSPRNVLRPLNGVGNRNYGTPTVGKRPLKEMFSSEKSLLGPRESPGTPYLSSKRLKMITEQGFSYGRDAHMQDVCRMSDLSRRLKLHFNQVEREEILTTITQLAKHIDEGRLRMKKGCAILADVALRKKALHVLLNYNAYWLRIGLHVVLGHTALLKEKLSQEHSPEIGDKGLEDEEYALLEVFLEKHFLAHPGLAKLYATNKAIEGLYKDGYPEALGKVILKRFFLLVLVLDKAKRQNFLKISDGIDGVDGGSPSLFRSTARVKSSRQALQEFLSDVMHGEGDVIGNLSALGYHVHHHQVPLADYDFAIADLVEDLQDGVRLCRLVQLLAANDTFFLEHIQVPSNGRKRQLHNCQIALESLAQAGVPLEDEEGCSISAEDIVGGNREKVFPLLWNIMVHLQIPLLVSRPRLCQEIASLQGTEGGFALGLNIGTVELLLKWTQVTCMISGNLNIRNFKTSFADGQALCYIINFYLPLFLPQKAVLRPSFQSNLQQVQYDDTPDIKGALSAAYKKAVAHNFGLVQEVIRKIGSIPEVLQLVDLLGDPGMSERNIIIFVAFLCSKLLKDRPLDLQLQKRRNSFDWDTEINHHLPADDPGLCSYSSQCSLESESPSGFNRSYTVSWTKCEAPSSTLQPVLCGHTELNGLPQAHYSESTLRKICKLQAWWRSRQARVQFLTQKRAVQKIERRWLSFKKEAVNLQHYSGSKIQAYWQGFLSRQMCKSWTGTVLIFGRSEERENAALVIQRRWRTFREEAANLQYHCASKIQAHWRGFLLRQMFKRWKAATLMSWSSQERERAAQIIQSYFRAWVGKRRYLMTVSNMCKIQAFWWAQEARGNFLIQWKAVQMIESWWLRLLARRKHCAAAQFIQDNWRRYLARRNLSQQIAEYNLREEAAVTIQIHVRIWLKKREFQTRANQIVKIQAYWRGRMTRLRVMGEVFYTRFNHVIKLQAFWRARIGRKRFTEKKQAVNLIQRHWRDFLARRRNLAATLIQAGWRGLEVRRKFSKWRANAITIQSYYRGRIDRTWFIRLKETVIRLQGCYRAYRQKRCYQAAVDAICKLQAFWRARTGRNLFLIQKTASKTIQFQWRAFLSRRREVKATKIQAKWRGYLVRKALKQKTEAACLIQEWFRCLQRRSNFVSYRKAAFVIQAHYRAYIRRRNQETIRRICTIQAIWRACKGRRQFLEQRLAVVLIQRRYRAHSRRRLERQLLSVCKIQAWWRGLKVRRLLLEQRRASQFIEDRSGASNERRLERTVCQVQAIWRAKKIRQHFLLQRKATAIVQVQYRAYIQGRKASILGKVCKIQAIWRGYKVRQQFLTRRKAAEVIQAHYRAYIQRRDQFSMRRLCRVQAVWRSNNARRQFLKQRNSVLRIQSAWRRFITSKRHYSAVKIQAMWRCYSSRRVYWRRKAAAALIQSWFRCHKQRRNYSKLKTAVLIIQVHVKGWNQRRAYRHIVDGKCKFQALYRARKALSKLVKERNVIPMIQVIRDQHSAQLGHQAAVHIQATWRGFLVRKMISTWKVACMQIQKQCRVYIHKRNYCNATSRAVSSATFRRPRVEAYDVGITRFQALVRGHILRRRLRRLNSAASQIQFAFRAWCASRLLAVGDQTTSLQLTTVKMTQADKSENGRCHDEASQILHVAARGGLQSPYSNASLGEEVVVDSQPEMREKELRSVVFLQAMFRGASARRRRRSWRSSARRLSVQELGQLLSAGGISSAAVKDLICSGIGSQSALCNEVLAANMIQAYWRGHLVRKHLSFEKSSVDIRNGQKQNFVIQVVQREFSQLELDAAQTIFTWFRFFKDRSFYLRLRRCTVIIQRRVRGWIGRSKFLKIRSSIITLQAHWRALLTRRDVTQVSLQLEQLRQRMQCTAATVQDSDRLGNRLTEALALLLGQKTVSGILSICRTIDVATLHSRTCCARLAEAGAITKILHLIQTMNRSPPHEQVLKHALSILTNLAHYLHLRTLIAEAPGAINIITEQLHMFRNKEEIFAQAISLLQLVCELPIGVKVLQREPLAFRRLQLVAQSLERKVQVEKRNLDRLPPSTTAVQRKLVEKRFSEVSSQFLSLMSLLKEISKLDLFLKTTTPVRALPVSSSRRISSSCRRPLAKQLNRAPLTPFQVTPVFSFQDRSN